MSESRVIFIDDFSDCVSPKNSDEGLRVVEKTFSISFVDMDNFFLNKGRQANLEKRINEEEYDLKYVLGKLKNKNLKPQERVDLLVEKNNIMKKIKILEEDFKKVYLKNLAKENEFFLARS